jgi:hypothetical protein
MALAPSGGVGNAKRSPENRFLVRHLSLPMATTVSVGAVACNFDPGTSVSRCYR